MGHRMTIEPIHDNEIIEAVARIPHIWDDAAEDGADGPYINDDDLWLCASDERGMVGIYRFNQLGAVLVQCHPLTVRKGTDGYKAAMGALEWVFDNTRCAKVVCHIPVIYRHIKLFAMRLGFLDEGVN